MLAGKWRETCQERKVEDNLKEIKQERMGPVFSDKASRAAI
jgi:hypothetical protein